MLRHFVSFSRRSGHTNAPLSEGGGGGGDGSPLGSPSIAAYNTTVGNDMSPDGLTWAAVRGAFVIDQYGKYIQYVQAYNSNTRQLKMLVSNDEGVTWEDMGTAEGFLTRGDIVYDASRDCLHALTVTTNPGDGGVIYRRHSITRDGSNNITAIARVGGVSVSLDLPSGGSEHPTIIMPSANYILAAWTIYDGEGGEIRAVRCDISGNADAGGTASNWTHIGVNSTNVIMETAPNTASYTAVFTRSAVTAPDYFALKHLSGGNLVWIYHTGNSPGQWFIKRSVWAGSSWTSFDTATLITNVQRAGTDTGYSLKQQLVSQITEGASSSIYVGLATWKSNADGDTWSIYKITSANAITIADVYSAGGAHSYAPTGDVAYDSTSDKVLATYAITGADAEYAHLTLWANDLSAMEQTMTLFDTLPADIPIIASTRDNGSVLVTFRESDGTPTPPYIGYFGTVPWSS